MSIEGKLYVVATPIGNLGDMSPRAVEVLRSVDAIAAEDTRHSSGLLRHFDVVTPTSSLHEHNERQVAESLVRRLHGGEDIALISDAGTPLISDPGYRLVRLARSAGIRVVPVPGPNAGITALSASGLPTDRFMFEGFLPSRSGARRRSLAALADEPRTMIFYESPWRVVDTLRDMVEVFGPEREGVLARELTKAFETIRGGGLGELLEQVSADPDQRRGEIVILLHGAPTPQPADSLDSDARRVAQTLAEELPPKKAATLTARLCGVKKNRAYEFIVQSKDR